MYIYIHILSILYICTLKFLIVGGGEGGVNSFFRKLLTPSFPFINTPPNYVFHAKSHSPHFIGDPPPILEKQRHICPEHNNL